MAVSSTRATAGGTAVALNTADVAALTLVVSNSSANAADLGPSGVTGGNGFLLAGGDALTVHLDAGDVLFAIETVAATPADLSVLRT